jgi:hypothetical protein
MPPVTTDPGILAAARSGIDMLLQFKGQSVTLSRKGLAIAKPGGGHDFGRNAILPQIFSLSQVGDDEISDASSGDTQVVKRRYVLTGVYNADIKPDDTFSTAEADFRVETVNATSGYKTHADVVGFVKVG